MKLKLSEQPYLPLVSCISVKAVPDFLMLAYLIHDAARLRASGNDKAVLIREEGGSRSEENGTGEEIMRTCYREPRSERPDGQKIRLDAARSW
jgi:hypothetical protein